MKINLLPSIVICLFLVSCGQPDVNGDCSITGNGNASCSFQNLGTAEGSICYALSLERNQDQEWYENGRFYPDNIYGSVGDKIVSSSEICSGIVKPNDIVEREKFVSFSGLTMMTLMAKSPTDWCSKHPGFGSDKDYGTAWYAGCNFSYGENETAFASEEAIIALAEALADSDDSEDDSESSDSN
jgi:hypothetical protein|tara:strand:+ start:199 stop:753 length:555 start_codon:yes stop_codon:yes gene_type:complete